jgi:hypothetical protein
MKSNHQTFTSVNLCGDSGGFCDQSGFVSHRNIDNPNH